MRKKGFVFINPAGMNEKKKKIHQVKLTSANFRSFFFCFKYEKKTQECNEINTHSRFTFRMCAYYLATAAPAAAAAAIFCAVLQKSFNIATPDRPTHAFIIIFFLLFIIIRIFSIDVAFATLLLLLQLLF